MGRFLGLSGDRWNSGKMSLFEQIIGGNLFSFFLKENLWPIYSISLWCHIW